MIERPRLRWNATRRLSWPAIAVLAVCLVVGAGLLQVKRGFDAQIVQREVRLARAAEVSARAAALRAKPPAAPSATALRQLQEQVRLINRNWEGLTVLLAPSSRDVRLLGMDVNPGTGAVRVTGRASNAVVANAYAEALGHGSSGRLQRVRLVLLERRADGIKFEVSAQWVE